MKRILLIVAFATTMFSCTPDDQCGTVTDWGIDNYGNTWLRVDGTKHNVTTATWYKYNIGDSICIEY